MTRLVAAIRRLIADPRPSALGDRPWTLRLFDSYFFNTPARRWN